MLIVVFGQTKWYCDWRMSPSNAELTQRGEQRLNEATPSSQRSEASASSADVPGTLLRLSH
jgi:hypothetical protein